jgi:hypothetical protein
MILLSSHLDRVVQDYDLAYHSGLHVGLLDNAMGVMLTYLTLYDDHNLIELEKEGKLGIWHGKGEEWGRLMNAPTLTKKDLVIVVDVAAGSQYKGKDFGLENISGLSKKQVQSLEDDLEWQGLKPLVKLYTGAALDEDEGWKWRELGVPVISFILPIFAKDDGWHRIQMDNSVSSEVVLKARQGLKRIITHFVDDYAG